MESTYKKMMLYNTYKVLQNFGMMLVAPCQQKDFTPPKDTIVETSIDFTGEKQGEITIVSTEKWYDHLACNILGINSEKELEPGIGHSAATELINIICGHFLNSNFGQKSNFNISTPTIRNLTELEFFDFESNQEVMELIADKEKIYTLVIID